MLTQEVASLVQSNPASLDQMMVAFGDYLDNRESVYKRNERILREVGELSKGRAFISASLLARALRIEEYESIRRAAISGDDA